MKRKIFVIMVVIAFIFGLFGIKNVVDEKEREIIQENMVEKQDEVESKVLEVNEVNFEEEVLKSDKKVLVDFYADWCGPCRQLSPIIDEVAEELSNVKFVRVNIDNNERLKEEYNAYTIPKLVVIENGKEIKSSVGAIPKGQVLKLLK